MTRGFAPPRPAPRTAAVWFSCYAQDNEDDPLTVTSGAGLFAA